MKSLIILIIVVIIAGFGWYFYSGQNLSDLTGGEEEMMDEEMMSYDMRVTLASQNNSGESGEALIYDEEGRIRVVLNLTGTPAGVVQPAHIHNGSCSNLGGVKYPLTFPVDGKSETILDISLAELLGGLPLAINVHKSPEEASVYVACGDLKSSVSDGGGMMSGGNTMMEDEEVMGDEMTQETRVINISGRNFAFSQGEIRVKKGDRVTVNFENTGGFHDWVVDEFNARTSRVNAGEKTSVTFVADKTGTFEYYCSVGNHRQLGMVGNLIVE